MRGQTARVTVSNAGAPNGLPPGPCRATVTFYSGNEQVLLREVLWLAPGQTGVSDYATLVLPSGRLRAGILIEPLDSAHPAVVAPSVEIFAADTGRSAVLYARPDRAAEVIVLPREPEPQTVRTALVTERSDDLTALVMELVEGPPEK